jgi:hypothetical protein
VAFVVEVLTYNRHAARPALAEKRRRELLRQGKDWRVTGNQVRVTRELIHRPDRRSADEFASLVRADIAAQGASDDALVRVIEISTGRGPRGAQPRFPLKGGG